MDLREIILTVEMVILSVVWLPAVLGTAYLWYVYMQADSRPWILQMMSISSTLVTINVVYFSFLTFLRLLGIPALGMAPVSGFVIGVLGFVPIYKAFRVWQAAHGEIEPPKIPSNGHSFKSEDWDGKERRNGEDRRSDAAGQ